MPENLGFFRDNKIRGGSRGRIPTDPPLESLDDPDVGNDSSINQDSIRDKISILRIQSQGKQRVWDGKSGRIRVAFPMGVDEWPGCLDQLPKP